MKTTKKLLAVALVLVMLMGLGITALAADGYTITIANPADGETYTAYKVFDVSYDETAADPEAFAYTITHTAGATDDLYSVISGTTGLTFTQIRDTDVYSVTAADTFDAAAFAATLSANIDKLTAAGTNSGATITVSAPGYYFVDTTLGSLCSLDTAQNVTIYEKNTIPTLTKEVKDDAEGSEWGDTAQGDMGQSIQFQLTVNTGTNEEYIGNTDDEEALGNGVDANYVITDTLPEGMTYMDDAAVAGWDASDYTVGYADDVLTITLLADKIATLGQDADIVITYSARIDTDAVVGGTGNINTATLSYKEQTTTEVSATVFTYEFEILKVTGDEEPLAGVKFTLQNADEEYYIASTENSSIWQEAENELVTDAQGVISFVGLDADVYTLTETDTVDGYNMLSGPLTVTIDEEGNVTVTGDGATVEEGSIQITVVNQAGTILPSTGGIGTTIFYILGTILVIGAGIVLVAKRRVHE